jgi:cysteine desulfurase
VSLPPGTAGEDVERFLSVLPEAVAGVRGKLGAPTAAEAAAGEDVLVVDALGRRCPIPVIELAKVIGNVPVGGTVRVLSDDEAARLDIPAWCEMRGQEYVGEEPADQGSAYLVRRVS